jgi:hypothetical protein
MKKIVLSSNSADNLRLISELAQKIGVKVETIEEKSKEKKLLHQIEQGLKEVKDIQTGKKKRKSLNDLLNGK